MQDAQISLHWLENSPSPYIPYPAAKEPNQYAGSFIIEHNIKAKDAGWFGTFLSLCHILSGFLSIVHGLLLAQNTLTVLLCLKMTIRANSNVTSVKSSLIPFPTEPTPPFVTFPYTVTIHGRLFPLSL